jgi:hypothetical protein
MINDTNSSARRRPVVFTGGATGDAVRTGSRDWSRPPDTATVDTLYRMLFEATPAGDPYLSIWESRERFEVN